MKKRFFIFCCLLVVCASIFAQKNYQVLADELLKKMTLDEKIGQLTLYTSGWTVTGPSLNDNYKNDVRSGKCGNIFNAHTAQYNRDLQKIAVEETRLGIPLLFGYDVIHGYKTIFPIPIGESCSWDLELIEKTARLSAKEAAAGGLHWTFNPMVDIARDPRWGRIAEGSGEDPYLGGLIGAAKVKGTQGSDLADKNTLLACVKHFAAYGAAQAGRDYHTVDISDIELRQTYLPTYKKCIDAGCKTVMTSFNELHGVPVSGSKYLMNDILREEWNFDGFIVTDYTAINEMIEHGFSEDLKHAASQSINAGVDMDMQGGAYQKHLKKLIEEGMVKEETIDKSVRRILIAKYELGLFDDPYRYSDTIREQQVVRSEEMMQHSREAATRSMVLLKNDSIDGLPLLPLSTDIKKVAVIGPLGNNKVDQLGSWHASGESKKTVTLFEALKKEYPTIQFTYLEGASTTDKSKPKKLDETIELASKSDLVILALGENYRQSGEAASRTNIDLPGNQLELAAAIVDTKKPIVAVLMAGRPMTINYLQENVPAILYAWQPGTMGGPAIADLLYGKVNPSAKLTITFPRSAGQIPIYYSMKNTGRPYEEKNKYTSKYIDSPNEPLYPFGYGLSYTTYKYSNLKVSSNTWNGKEKLKVTITVKNTGSYNGEEIVQLYIRDRVASLTRPVKELKGFKKIKLIKGESKNLVFELEAKDLAFYHPEKKWITEPGKFDIMVGSNSSTVHAVSISYQP